MLKDINGKTDITFYNESIINNIDELFEQCRFTCDLSSAEVIGFVKFNPFLKGDNRYRNILDRNSWYPIVAVGNDLSVTILNMKPTHIGLFSNIVAVNPHNRDFDQIKNTEPRVKKYWNKKQAEQKANEEYLIELEINLKKERERSSKVHDKLGNQPTRSGDVSAVLKKHMKEDKFFRRMKKNNNQSFLLTDISYRLELIHFFENNRTEHERSYDYNCRDYRHKARLIELKDKIEQTIKIEAQVSFSNVFKKIKESFLSIF